MKNFTFYFIFLMFSLAVGAQTTLDPGDIAFIGTNSDGATYEDDTVAFVLLKDIDAATNIIFTDRGWNDDTGFLEFPGDSQFTWTSGEDRKVGDVVELNLTPLFPASYSTIGDQMFAIQGSIELPVFIAGIHTNVNGFSTDGNWDGTAENNSTSALPNDLTNGVNAMRFTTEFDNGQFSAVKAGGNNYGSIQELRLAINNIDNWNFSNDTSYNPATEPGINFNVQCVPSSTPNLTLTNNNICPGSSTTINISGNLNDATEWVIYSDSCGETLVGRTSTTSFEVTPLKGDTTYYIRGEDGAGCLDESISECANIVVTAGDNTPPTITCPENIEVNSDEGICGAVVTYNVLVTDDCEISQPEKTGFIALGVYSGKYYYKSVGLFTPEAAFTDSQSNGGDVVTINDASENSFINGKLTEGSVIIGLTDREVEGQFVWENGEAVSYTNWGGGEPNNSGNEDYAELYFGGAWNDIPNSVERPYILEVNIATQTAGLASGSEFPVGKTTNTFEVTDASGNKSTCSFDIIVNDTGAPTAIAQNITVELDENGEATITAAQINDGSSDLCGDVTLSLDKTTFSCADVGSASAGSTAVNITAIGSETQATNSHGGGYNPNTDEFLYPIWSGNQVSTYDASHQATGSFTAPVNQIMQIWMDKSSTDYYTAIWGNATINRINTTNNIVWSYNIGTTAVGVTTDEDYVYAIANNSNTIVVLNKETGAFVKNIGLPGAFMTYGGLIYANGLFYIAGRDLNNISPFPNSYNAIHTFNAETGEYISSVSTSAATFNSSFDGENIWVSQNSNTIHGYKISEGNAYDAGGSNKVILTVTDEAGNKSTAIANVTVEDNTPPSITCLANIEVDNDSGVDGAVVDFEINTSDNCSISKRLTKNNEQFTGGVIICNNPAFRRGFMVIYDLNKEGIAGDFFLENLDIGFGSNSNDIDITVNLYYDTAIQNEISTYDVPLSDNIIPFATTTVKLNFDNTNFIQSIPFNISLPTNSIVYVEVVTPQSIVLPTSIDPTQKSEFGLIFSCENSSNYRDFGSEGAQNTFIISMQGREILNPVQTAGLSSGSEFPVGTTTNTFEVTDASGNKSTCSFDITVNDVEAPKDYTVSIDQEEIDETNETAVSFTFAAAEVGAFYNYSFSSGNGATFSIGTGTIASATDQITGINLSDLEDGTITLSVTLFDEAGNEGDAATDTVIKNTNEAPVAVCENFIAQLDEGGSVTILPNDVDGGSSDDREGFTLSLDIDTFSCSNIGTPVNVTLTITDSNGVTDTCTATVTVEDNIAPDFVTSDVTLQLDSNGFANLTPEQVIINYNIVSISGDNGSQGNTDFTVQLSSDADISFDWDYSTNDGAVFDTFGYMLNNVYNQLTNNSFGNFQNGTFSLNVFENDIFGFRSYTSDGVFGASTTIVSNFSPGFVSQFAPNNWQLNVSNAGGDAYFEEDNSGSALNDACGISSIEITPNAFSCLDLGENTVTITVTDVNGNVTEKIAVVTVEDNIAPEITQPEDLVLNTNNDECSYTFLEALTVEASDNCTIETITGVRSDGLSLNDPFPLGETIISWTATDASGNVFPSSEKFEERVLSSQTDFSGEETYIDFDGLMDRDAITDEFLEQGVLFLLDDGSEFGTGVGVEQFGSGENKVLINASPSDDFPKVYNLEMIFPQGVHRVGFEIISPFMGSELPVKFVRNGEIIHNETYLINESSNFIGYESPELFDQVIIEIPTSFDGGDGPFPGDDPFPGDGPIPGDAPMEFSIVFMDNLRFEGANEVESIVQKITVIDEQAAEVVAKDITVQLDETGNVSITAEDVDNGSNDACGIASMSVSPSTFTCAEVGENTVTLTVIDNNGNESTTTSTVTVEDNVAAIAIAKDITVQLDETGNVSITAEDVDNDSNDACGIASMSVSPSAFTCAEVGENTVTLTVIDNNGNESTTTSTVTVEDNVAAIAIAKDITVQLDDTGNVSITAEDVDNNSNDACGIASMSVSPSAFTCAEVGDNTVTLTVIDNNGNESTTTSTVTVEDNIAANAIAKDITVQLDETGNVSITAEDVDNDSNDACGIASMSVSPSAFTCAEVGDNTVTLTVIDNNGNESTTTSTVTVEDNVAAIAIAKDITVQLDDTGNVSITAEDVDNNSNDACGIASMSVSPSAFTCAEVGDNTVTLTVIDNNGNESTTTSTVTVEDNIAAIAIAKDITVQLDDTGNVEITAEDIDNGSNDACGIQSMSVSPNSFTCSDVGDNTVTLTVVDNNGNESTTTSIVTVEDNVAAIAIAKDITVQLDETGNVMISAEDIDNGSNDACGIASMSVSPSAFTCAEVGDNTVTLTVIDNNGNESTTTSTVTVEDNIATNAIAKDITVQLDDTGNVEITAEDIDNGSNDACGIASMSVSPSTFTCAEVGENTVTLTVIDNNGNESTTTSTVTVEDKIAPIPSAVSLSDITAVCEVLESDVTAPTASDNCGGTIKVTHDASFPITTQGLTVITWSFEDANGNIATQTQDVMLEDLTAPVPDVESLEDIIVECEAATIEAPTATDTCAGTVTGTTLDPTSYSEEGEFMILWEFNDGNGNVSTQEQWVTVKDNTAPEVITQDLTVIVTQDEPAMITPEEINDGSTDNCSELVYTLDRDTFDKPGVYEVVLTATDASGNTSQATATITVKREGADPKGAHVVPTMLTRSTIAKVILPFNGRINEVHVMETETNNYKVFEGNKKNTMQIDIAPMKGTLLVKIIDAEGNVYMKKLIAL